MADTLALWAIVLMLAVIARLLLSVARNQVSAIDEANRRHKEAHRG